MPHPTSSTVHGPPAALPPESESQILRAIFRSTRKCCPSAFFALTSPIKLYIVGNKQTKKPAQNRIAGELQSTPANKSAAAAPKTGIIATFGSIRQKDETPPPHPARSLLHRRRFGTTQSPIRPAARRRAGENARRRYTIRRQTSARAATPPYYESLVGQRILFYPRDIHADLRPAAYFNFLAETPAVVRIDTALAAQTPQKGPPRGFPDRHPLQRYLPSPVLQRRNDSRLRMHDNGVARSRTGPLSDGSRNGLVHPGGSHRRKNLRNNRPQDTQNPGSRRSGFSGSDPKREKHSIGMRHAGKTKRTCGTNITRSPSKGWSRSTMRHTSAGSSSSRSANPKLRDMFPDTSDCRPRPCRAKRTG